MFTWWPAVPESASVGVISKVALAWLVVAVTVTFATPLATFAV